MKSTAAHIWLSYVSYPVTTAAYLERALRKICRVTTIGPRLPEELIIRWDLHNLNQPVRPHDIDTPMSYDLADILTKLDPSEHPDLYLWVESVGGHQPRNLEALSCPKIGYLIDTHLSLDHHRELAKQFDFVFLVHRQFVDEIKKVNPNTFWLPVACDPEIHSTHKTEKCFNIGFVGSIQPGSRRQQLLNSLASQFQIHYERCFWDDMAHIFSQSQIVFNEAVKNDLNMRVFEVMSTGSLLLTDMARNSGQDELFRDGEDYAVYRDNTICDVARFYLDNTELREQIAARGRLLVHNAHTYAHRMEDLLAVVLGNKPDTFSAQELRARSLAGVQTQDAVVPSSICISSARRSFVIPVLDMSPASEYNILTLLDDLKCIEGDVIVIFNGQDIAEQVKNHPRITRYAVMKHNIGVARAWNLGLEIAATPTVFILNADLHVEKAAIDALEQALISLPNAACVGPQGSFFEFALARDYVYFDKGTFNKPLVVDAVSGFFFAIKLQHFNDKIIRFENGFTPCYFEEWDIGLQIKQAGLKNYIVPVTEYEHHWSGTIRALREIEYYEKAETAGEILLRNRRTILNKWRAIAERTDNAALLESGFMNYIADQAELLISEGRYSEAKMLIDKALLRAPENDRIFAMNRFCTILAEKTEHNKQQNQGA
ncbi:MAG: glycosyltransferase [Desulfuromonadaceae bacterium]|nr:glycosyltransferase [Desulfuromonadaceae bacterium]